MSLSVVKTPALDEQERIIERGRKAFVEVGLALLAIKQQNLYKGSYRSFAVYCEERWGFKRSYGDYLIESAKTAREVTTIVGTSPGTEAQARELARAEAPAEVWAEVVEQHEPAEITAAVIREHVEARKPQTEPAPILVEVVQDAEVIEPVDSFALMAACDAIEEAVRDARRLGATSQEMYDAYQRGLQ